MNIGRGSGPTHGETIGVTKIGGCERLLVTGHQLRIDIKEAAQATTRLLAIADDANALLAEINLVLGAGRIGSATLAPLATAVQSMASGTDPTRRNRIYAALVLVLAAPEFLAQK